MSDRSTSSISPCYSGLIIAHRGTTDLVGENLVASLSRLDSWVAGVECDVRLTADEVPVVMHDADVARTTDGAGAVDTMTIDTIKQLMSAGHPIPTLTEYLAACEGRGLAPILIDLKDESIPTLMHVAEAVGRSVLKDQCILLSSARRRQRIGHDTGRVLRDGGHGLRLGSLGANRENIADVVAWSLRHSAELVMLDPNAYVENRECVSHIVEAGLMPGASTIDDRASWDAAREDEVALILTNRSHELERF